MRNVCIFSQLVFRYSHGSCFLRTFLELNPRYGSVLGKHKDKQTLWEITIYRTHRVSNSLTLVLGSLLSDKTASVNSCIFLSSFIAQEKND